MTTTAVRRSGVFMTMFALVVLFAAVSALTVAGGDHFAREIRGDRLACGSRLRDNIALAPNFYTCGDSKCKCQGTFADCSNRSMTYIPKLPKCILHLDFSDNWYGPTMSDDFFHNVTELSTVDLSFNSISRITSGAFRILKRLKTLILESNTFLTYEGLEPVFSIKTLEYLDIGLNTRLGPLPDGMFHKYPLPRLETLCMEITHMKTLNMTTLTPLLNLRHVYFSGNPISDVLTDFLPQLASLDFAACSLRMFLVTCRNGTSLFPRLQTLNLWSNTLYGDVYPQVCLPKLQHLYIGGNKITDFFTGMFEYFPALVTLDMESMGFPFKFVEKGTFRSPTLQFISLMNNHLDFAADFVHAESFDELPSINILDFRQNDFSAVTAERFRKMFGHLTTLTDLHLGSTNIKRVTASWFEGLSDLQYLDLSDNKLTDLPDGVFDGLRSLRLLALSDNQIPVIREQTFSAALRRQLLRVGLDGNPFRCSCELKWFQRWLTNNQSLFNFSQIMPSTTPRTRIHFTCGNLPNTTVQSFVVNDQSCLLSHFADGLIIFSVSFLVVTLTVSIMLFRYRWHIRLVMYEAFRGRGERWRRLQEHTFQYDIFVSYDSEDLHWVRAHLMPELEEGLGLKLCIHERDFIPGKNIVDNIADCVEASKKVMMLFSTSFAKSQWCQFELNYCLSHVMETDDALLVAFLHDVPSRDLTPAMMAVMKTTTYIEWADEPDARASFWRRIHIALSEILPGV